MRAGFTGPGTYLVCPVVDCDWKIRHDQYGTTGFAHFTDPADSMEDAIHRAALNQAAELEATIKAHINDDHPNIVTDLMRTIQQLTRQLEAAGWPEGFPPGWTGTSVPGGQVDLEAGG